MKKLWLFLLMTPLLALAQPRELYPWWDSPVARDLNLTDAQTKQIRATVKEYRDRLLDLRATADKADGALQDVFNEDPVDQAKAAAAIDHLAAARGELTKTLSQLTLRLRTVLTAQQWQELQRRGPRGPGFRGRGGPGGFNSPTGRQGDRRGPPQPPGAADLKQN